MKRTHVCSKEGPCPLPRGDNYEIAKIHWQNLKIFLSRIMDQFQPNLEQSILRWRGFNYIQLKGPTLFQGEIMGFSSPNQCYDIILALLKCIIELNSVFSGGRYGPWASCWLITYLWLLQLRQQLSSLENKYRSEIKELQQILADSKIRAKETEDSLRKEVSSLKLIIQDLEDRLGKPLKFQPCLLLNDI